MSQTDIDELLLSALPHEECGDGETSTWYGLYLASVTFVDYHLAGTPQKHVPGTVIKSTELSEEDINFFETHPGAVSKELNGDITVTWFETEEGARGHYASCMAKDTHRIIGVSDKELESLRSFAEESLYLGINDTSLETMAGFEQEQATRKGQTK